MKIPEKLRVWLLQYLWQKTYLQRNQDVNIGDMLPSENPKYHGTKVPQLARWHLISRNNYFNIYVHQFHRSDSDRHLHDHPYLFNISVILRGQYCELLSHEWEKYRSETRRQGQVIVRLNPFHAHKVILEDNTPVWTLFIGGPRVRNWGFHVPHGWIAWDVYLKAERTKSYREKF